MVNDIAEELPLAQCDPVVFHQIMLRAVRHARRTLGPSGTLNIVLKPSTITHRACLSCRESFEGDYLELVVEDSDSKLSAGDLDRLSGVPSGEAPDTAAPDDLAAIHALCHSQGGHLQIQRAFPSGCSVHVFLKVAAESADDDGSAPPRSTVTRFPRERTGHH